MTEDLSQLAVRLRGELDELDRVVGRVNEGWRRAQGAADDYYLDGVALNLHGFYAGLERIFELVAGSGGWCQAGRRELASDLAAPGGG